MADDAIRIGPAAPAESYLRIDAIIDAARATGADAIHPGYGFLAERAAFARAVIEAGLIFVGPPAEAIEALGDKLAARRLARRVGVATVPGTLEPAPVDGPDALPAILAAAEEIGFPLLVKAAAGGGGRGMRRVESAADLPEALTAAAAEAAAAFGDGAVYLEREVRPARHIEVQLLGDVTGEVVAIGERDCSIQRRHQKLVEESPAPGLTDGRTAGPPRAGGPDREGGRADERGHGRVPPGAGRVDLLPRGQHPAPGRARGDRAGHRPRPRPGAVRPGGGAAAVRGGSRGCLRRAAPDGHAIEVRLTAEDPSRDFAPTPGRIRRWVDAGGTGHPGRHRARGGRPDPARVRQPDGEDHGGAADRAGAIDRLRRALDATEVAGAPDHSAVPPLRRPRPGFRAGDLSTELGGGSTGTGRRHARPRAERGRGVAGAARGRGRGAARHLPGTGDGWAAARDEAIDRWPGDPPSRSRTGRPAAAGRARRWRPAGPARRGPPAGGERSSPGLDPVEPSDGGGLEVVVDGWRFEFDVEDVERAELRARATSGRDAAAHDGPIEVRAIIPGRVVSVAVEPGDAVTAGAAAAGGGGDEDGERGPAPRDGTVERVAVGPGDTVELGDVLVVIR